MKQILLSIVVALMASSCQFRSGDGQKYTAWNVGIRETGVAQTGQGYYAAQNDGTDAFREAAKTTRFGLGTAAVTSVAKTGFNSLTSTKNATTAAGASKSKDAAAIKAAQIQSAERIKLAEMEAAAALQQ